MIPAQVRLLKDWKAESIFLTVGDAQKIRFHQSHGMGAFEARAILRTIESGDYYSHSARGTDRQIEVVLHNPDDPKRCHFLVLARNVADDAIFVRTFYRTNKMSRSKFVGGEKLLVKSNFAYFKGL